MNITILDSANNKVQISVRDLSSLEYLENRRNHIDEIVSQINDNLLYEGLINADDLIVLDIGANVGLFSVYAAGVAEKVFSIEPSSSSFKVLNEIAGSFTNIVPLNVAVGPQNGETTLFLSSSNSTMNSLVNSYGLSERVMSVTLLDLLEKLGLERVDLVKMDIEGGEFLVILPETLKNLRERVKRWYVEIHVTNTWFRREKNWVRILLAVLHKLRISKILLFIENIHLKRNSNRLKNIFSNEEYSVTLLRRDAILAERNGF